MPPEPARRMFGLHEPNLDDLTVQRLPCATAVSARAEVAAVNLEARLSEWRRPRQVTWRWVRTHSMTSGVVMTSA